MEAARYLDMLHTVRLSDHLNINDTYSLEKIMVAGNVEVECARNEQERNT